MPWASIVYGIDFAWWQSVQGLPQFGGLKLCADPMAAGYGWGVEHCAVTPDRDRLELLEPGRLGWGGNSGFQALNLAVQLRPRRILMVGFDMTLAHGVHWHGRHQNLGNPTNETVRRWARVTDQAAAVIAELGIEAINCSPVSALRQYRRASLEDVIEC